MDNRRIKENRAPGKLKWDEVTSTREAAAPVAAERFGYRITPRAAHAGGGWRLQLLEGGKEVGGDIYPSTGSGTGSEAYIEALADADAWLLSRGQDIGAAPADSLTDEDIQIIWQTMPGGPAGWLKSFGFLQFARAVEDEMVSRCRAQGGNTSNNVGSPAAPSAASIEGLTHYLAAEVKPADVVLLAADVERLLATQSAKQGAQPEPVAYLHQVVCGDGEPDQALSFAPDNFPLAGTLGYRSLSHEPLYTAAQVQANVRDAVLDEAAQECVRHSDDSPIYKIACIDCADAIRAMKSKRAASTDGEVRNA